MTVVTNSPELDGKAAPTRRGREAPSVGRGLAPVNLPRLEAPCRGRPSWRTSQSQTARLADGAGVSPRVVQHLMRHSTLELTGRYTRSHAVDIEAAASTPPTLKPEGSQPETLGATGTDRRYSHRVCTRRVKRRSRSGVWKEWKADVWATRFPTIFPPHMPETER